MSKALPTLCCNEYEVPPLPVIVCFCKLTCCVAAYYQLLTYYVCSTYDTITSNESESDATAFNILPACIITL